MTPVHLKNLKKLADACRKAGIKSFKNAEFEFTLTEDAPVSNYKRKVEAAKQPTSSGDVNTPADFESDSLTQSELLYWSVGNFSDETEEQEVTPGA